MKRLTNGTAYFVLLILIGVCSPVSEAEARLVRGPGGSQYQRGQSSHEFLLEGGLAEPMGDQSDELHLVSEDPMANVAGLGQGTGYEVGFRFRQYLLKLPVRLEALFIDTVGGVPPIDFAIEH